MFRLPSREATKICIQDSTSSQEARGVGLGTFQQSGVFHKGLGGAKYFVKFIDDFSKEVWLYVLKTKDQYIQAIPSLG
jgi:hypothetical protein